MHRTLSGNCGMHNVLSAGSYWLAARLEARDSQCSRGLPSAEMHVRQSAFVHPVMQERKLLNLFSHICIPFFFLLFFSLQHSTRSKLLIFIYIYTKLLPMARSKASTHKSNVKAETGNSSQKDTKPQVGGQQGPPGDQPILQVAMNANAPKVTTTFWEDENTLCYQVEARGIFVSRRADTNFINGTKLLNVAGMTRGRRDGLLKIEPVRQVMKIGAMNLKGVWVPFDRAIDFAKRENIYDDLYPLFVEDIRAVLDRTSVVWHAASQNRSSIPGVGAYPIQLNEDPNMFNSSEKHKSAKARNLKESSKSMSVLNFKQKKGKNNKQDASAQNVITPNPAYGYPSNGAQDGSQIPPVNGYQGYPQPQQYPYYYQPFPPQPQGNGINGSIPQAQYPVAPIPSSQLGSSGTPGNATNSPSSQPGQGAQPYGYPPAYPPYYGFYPYYQPSPNGNGQQGVPPPMYPYNVSAYNYSPQPKPPKPTEEQKSIADDSQNNIQSDIPNNTQGDNKDIQNDNKNGDQKVEEAQEATSDDETKRVPKKRGRKPKKELDEANKSDSLKKTRNK